MGDDPSIGEYERLLLSMKTTARKELVLLHPDRSVVPGSTREWLKVALPDHYSSSLGLFIYFQNRPWVHQHIHVEMPVCQTISLPPFSTTIPRAWCYHRNPLFIRIRTQLRR